MSLEELPKTYKPAEHEGRVWDRWIETKSFHADPARVLSGEAKPYTVLIPPPNVTAALHLGHGLNNTLQDIIVRAKRMQGFEALWMPGTDHAGIATQAVVEKRVMKEEKKRRTDFSREDFIAKIQAFKDEYEATITGQLKKMGCSCDWDRQRFTMDEVCAAAVREAFFRLFKDGLIYRGKRLVNWDPALQTAVADDECYEEDVDTSFWYLRYPIVQGETPVTWNELATKGYPGAESMPGDEPAYVTVATTRPETYMGDTAVAINPHDPRAGALRGLSVRLPLLGRVIPIIEDSYVVLPKAMARTEEEASDAKAEFATGFLKVTPAHDPNDYEIGQRHALAMINMMSPDGRVSDKHGWNDLGDAHLFVGKTMAEARKLVVKEFEARGLLESIRPYRHSVKHSDRSKAVIEPYLSDQWYVKVTDPRLAGAANAALVQEQRTSSPGSSTDGDGSLRFFPVRYAKTYESWHDNIRDWCISRQLWWGHRIPVWSTMEGWIRAGRRGGTDLRVSPLELEAFRHQLVEWESQGRICVRGESEGGRDSVTATLGGNDPSRFICVQDENDREVIDAIETHTYQRDPDVLDTWFSSALWPMSTMGWPDPEAAARIENDPSLRELLKAFNPTTTLCTAREIITLWVSRMVMFNRYFMGEGQGKGPAPFRDVVIHAVVQDGEGRKMSKSLGNGVDPLDIIASHGADAMRFTVCKMSTQTQDVRLPVTRDPVTKANTSPKFDEGRNFCNKLWNAARFAMAQLGTAQPVDGSTPSSLIDRWMLSRVASSIAAINAQLENYEYSEYAQSIYDLLWRDFCDWYLEGVKATIATDPGQQAVLRATLDAILRLLHPIAPFVTEAIFEHVSTIRRPAVAGLELAPPRKGTLCTAGWPVADASLRDEKAEAMFDRARGLVTAIREVRASLNVPPKKKGVLHVPDELRQFSKSMGGLIESLAVLESIETLPAGGNKPAGSTAVRFQGHELILAGVVEQLDAGAERARLEKLIADLDKSIATLDGRLSNPGYADRAPAHMVQQTRDQLTKARQEREAAAASLAALP
jgi:valyl-tRNA synthetase